MWCFGCVPVGWGTWWVICVFWRWLETGLGSDDICERTEWAVRVISQEEAGSWNNWAVPVQRHFWNQEGIPLPLLEIPSGGKKKQKQKTTIRTWL